MTDSPAPADPGGLQFDRVEPKEPAAERVSCIGCKKPIEDVYFSVGGKVVCPACRQAVERERAKGSRATLFLRTFAFGAGGVLLGAAIFGIVRVLGVISGLVSLLVGFIIGKAVRKGSEGRGGVGFQVLAVLLTYLSIAVGYVPVIIKELAEKAKAPASAPAAPVPPPAEMPAASEEISKKAPTLGCLGATLLLSFIALTAPFFEAKNSILSAFLLALSMVEAWRLNRRVLLVFRGPFRVGEARPRPSEAPPLA